MTDTEAEALGKRLVACRHFRPLRGMLDMQGRTWDASLLWRWNSACDVPDLRDPATLGCVLALVREAWDDPYAYCYREDAYKWTGGWLFHVKTSTHLVTRRGIEEAEVLVAMLERKDKQPTRVQL